jgi:hypothetical protein
MNHNKIRIELDPLKLLRTVRLGQRIRYHEALDSCLHILEAGSQY